MLGARPAERDPDILTVEPDGDDVVVFPAPEPALATLRYGHGGVRPRIRAVVLARVPGAVLVRVPAQGGEVEYWLPAGDVGPRPPAAG